MNVQLIKRLGTATILIGLASLLTSCKAAGSQSQAAWRSIFDGRNTEGWKMTGPGELKLENGELVTYGGMGLLWYSPEKFGDCRIRVVFKLAAPDDDFGGFIRIPYPPSDPWYEVTVR